MRPSAFATRFRGRGSFTDNEEGTSARLCLTFGSALPLCVVAVACNTSACTLLLVHLPELATLAASVLVCVGVRKALGTVPGSDCQADGRRSSAAA